MIKIELEFNRHEASILSHTAMKSFFTEQRSRFDILLDSTAEMGWKSIICAEHAGRGVFLWFQTYLEAKVYQSYYMQAGNVDSVMLWDTDLDYEGPVLWVDERESFIMGVGHE